jgi:hypothetical protein
MIRLCLPLIALTATAACHPDTLGYIKAPPASTKCTADGLQPLIGKKRNASVERAAKLGSGANAIRWITPDMMVTMDYREDRLNIHLGTDGTIGSVKCG